MFQSGYVARSSGGEVWQKDVNGVSENPSGFHTVQHITWVLGEAV